MEDNRSGNYVAKFHNDGDNVDRHGIVVQCGSYAGGDGTVYFNQLNVYERTGFTVAEMEAKQQQQMLMAQLQQGQIVAGIDETSASAENKRAQASAVIANATQ